MAIDQAASLRNRGLGAPGAVLTLPTPPRNEKTTTLDSKN